MLSHAHFSRLHSHDTSSHPASTFSLLEQLINDTHVVYFIIKCHHAFVCYQSKHVVMK